MEDQQGIYIQDHAFSVGPSEEFNTFDYWVEMLTDDEFQKWVRSMEETETMDENDPECMKFDEYLGIHALVLWSHENDGARIIESNEKMEQIISIFIHNFRICVARRLGYVTTKLPLTMNDVVDSILTPKGHKYVKELATEDEE